MCLNLKIFLLFRYEILGSGYEIKLIGKCLKYFAMKCFTRYKTQGAAERFIAHKTRPTSVLNLMQAPATRQNELKMARACNNFFVLAYKDNIF